MDLINDESVCRTAPATPGLLMIFKRPKKCRKKGFEQNSQVHPVSESRGSRLGMTMVKDVLYGYSYSLIENIVTTLKRIFKKINI